jgi:hypothetical protein
MGQTLASCCALMSGEEFEDAFRRKWQGVLVDAVMLRHFVNHRQAEVDGEIDAVDAHITELQNQINEVFAQIADLHVRLNALEQNNKNLRPILQRGKIRGV